MEEVRVQVRQQDEKEDQGLHDHWDEEVQEVLDVGGLGWTRETCREQHFLFCLFLKSLCLMICNCKMIFTSVLKASLSHATKNRQLGEASLW